ncbi:hypothetical protein C0993_008486 [Termitomyces sp. T159_Od127]|nr:hypothetical protein C0993_008486 [Termitomyces sp. T159_Od127]
MTRLARTPALTLSSSLTSLGLTLTPAPIFHPSSLSLALISLLQHDWQFLAHILSPLLVSYTLCSRQYVASVMTRYRTPGLSPGPGTPALPKPPPQPPQARTATRPTPPAITGHHRLSTPQPLPLAASLAITAVAATSVPGLGYHVTPAPAPPVTPGPR